ncbi:MAG: RNA methyltransferase [Leeuwenhoekiella sp.]
MKEISSTSNPLIKYVLRLQEKSRERRKTHRFIVEGLREIQLAINAGYNLETLLFCSDLISEEVVAKMISQTRKEIELISLAKAVYEKIAYRSSTEGILAVAETKQHTLGNLKLSENPLLLIAEAPEKPGNIGALLRTADAAGVDAFIIANPLTDLYNPNLIRSSVGGVFTQQIATGSSEEVIQFLKKKQVKVYAAILQEAQSYSLQDYTLPTAIVVGTEALGLTEDWRAASTQNIIIPMLGSIDSMNVSVAAGILIFEARRQRGFK